MTDSNRLGAYVPRWAGGVSLVRPAADNADAQSGSGEATGIAGLSAAELSAMIRQSPVGDPSVPEALAPYLADTPGLSAEAYQEWLARVCEQPDDE